SALGRGHELHDRHRAHTPGAGGSRSDLRSAPAPLRRHRKGRLRRAMKARTIFAVILAYLVPGAGHLYLGRRGRAAAFFVIVVLMSLIGIAMDGEVYPFARAGASWLRDLAAIGTAGAGAMYFISLAAGAHGDITSITFEHGTAFAITAGLMNLLL